jgi:hypothetical protein
MPDAPSDREKFFDALDESFNAILDAIRAGNERGYRFSKRLTNEVEQAQLELSHLGRRFARDPRDLQSLYQSSVELARRAVTTSATLSREWMAGAQEAGRDARQTVVKVVQANRAASQALGASLQAAARGLAPSTRSEAPRKPAAKTGNSSS